MDILKFNNPRRTVLTTRGIIDVNEVQIGDKLFEYGTGEQLIIDDIENTQFEEMFLVKYTDSREDLVTEKDYIFAGNYLMTVDEFDIDSVGVLEPQVINFNRRPEFFRHDPYTTGAFLTYGNLESEYVSIVSDRFEKLESFFHMAGLYISGDDGNYIYFKNRMDELELWDDFFPMFDVSKDMDIPLLYAHADYQTRKKFLQGVFDFGYQPEVTPDYASINHNNLKVLKNVQRILWSMGILSIIIPETANETMYKYRLEIIDKHKYSSEFFKYTSYIYKMLTTDNRVAKLDPKFEWKVLGVYPFLDYTPNSFIPQFRIRGKERAIYLSGDYIPKVSL